jgi:hypothetical protein
LSYKEWINKLQTIESYLESLFPGFCIERIEDPLRSQLFRKHMFRIEDQHRGIDHVFSVDYDYLHRNTPEQIIGFFERRNLKKTLEEPGRYEVIMTDDGIRVISRKN